MCSRATDPYRPDAGCRDGQLEHDEYNDHSLSPRTFATNYKRRNTWNRYDTSQEISGPAVPDRLPTALAAFA